MVNVHLIFVGTRHARFQFGKKGVKRFGGDAVAREDEVVGLVKEDVDNAFVFEGFGNRGV
jgi:hypothetical protein